MIIATGPDTLIERLREEFTEPHLSMPLDRKYDKRRQHVFNTLRAGYTAAVTELFNELPAETL